MTTTAPPPQPVRSAWHAAHDPVPGVRPWVRRAALAIPFVVLPSSIWRIWFAFFVTGDNGRGDVPDWLPMQTYVVLLSILSELLAFAAIGLIARWGEVWPGWLPGLRGQRIPPAVALVPAFIGGAFLTAFTGLALVMDLQGKKTNGDPLPDNFPLHTDSWDGIVSIAAYAPLLLWGPLLLVVAAAYWRRRARVRREGLE
jgi:hypothetical protein